MMPDFEGPLWIKLEAPSGARAAGRGFAARRGRHASYMRRRVTGAVGRHRYLDRRQSLEFPF